MPKIVLKSKITNDNYTEYLYDNYDIQNREETTTEVPILSEEDKDIINKNDWNIFLILGKSGSGKSTILNSMGGATPIEYDHDKPISKIYGKRSL